MEKVFVYGTLKKGFGNHFLIENSAFASNGATVRKFYMSESGVPFVLDIQQSRYAKELEELNLPLTNVHGEIYEVDSYTLSRLDALEGHPYAYTRRKTDILTNNGTEQCWLYFSDTLVGHRPIKDGIYSDNADRLLYSC